MEVDKNKYYGPRGKQRAWEWSGEERRGEEEESISARTISGTKPRREACSLNLK